MARIIHGKGLTPNKNTPDYLLTKLNSARIFHHIDRAKDYAEITGVCTHTAGKRKHSIDDMTVKELYTLCNAMGITIEIPELYNNY